MKAIHNIMAVNERKEIVVYANAKILKWKQFTTAEQNALLGSSLFMLMQRY